MNDFTYCTPTRYQFGRKAEEQVGRLAKEAGMTRVLLVYGMGSAVRSGLVDRVKASLSAAGVEQVSLSGIRPNPMDDKVYEGIALGDTHTIDGLIAVGGGSVIDTAKAIAAGLLYDGDFWDFYAGRATVERALPVGVVLTIPAAGSEGSGNSVITRREGLVKVSLRTDFALRPKFACLNPELTYTLPPFQTACGICDMMVHILERYFTPTEGVETTDRLCEGLLMAIISQAHRVLEKPDDYDARANILWSGTLAHNGICGCGRAEDWASHFMEHELSALYDVAHGAGLAVIVPAFLSYMADHRPARVAQLGRRVFGVTDADDTAAARAAVDALRTFFSSINLPVSYGQLGVPDPDIDTMVRKVHALKGPKIGAYLPLDPTATADIYHRGF